ncbi:MAG: endonuclease/exonuclease/phosphatase family protein [Dokdonella sp.]
MRVATWNMHGGVGLDGRFNPDRIARVINELDADIIALQEFHSRDGFDMRAHLEKLGFAHVIVMPTFQKRGNEFGNALLTRLPPREVINHTLDLERREPRSAIDLTVDHQGGVMRIVATHLGLRAAERSVQVARMLDLFDTEPMPPTILLGDFNAWQARSLRAIDARFGMSTAPLTFPSPLPVVAFDRIWVSPPRACVDLRTHASRTARIASDHLPLVATIDFA